jgi:hypothetical protein
MFVLIRPWDGRARTAISGAQCIFRTICPARLQLRHDGQMTIPERPSERLLPIVPLVARRVRWPFIGQRERIFALAERPEFCFRPTAQAGR